MHRAWILPRANRSTLRAAQDGLVFFQYRPSRPVPSVDLRGDMIHWAHREPMRPAAPGLFEARLRVGPGVYSYKLRLADGAWELDPENPRTRAVDGVPNSVLVVGGAAEPLLHAPARPWVHAEDDGRLLVRAGLRRGAGERLSVRWDEGEGARITPMRAAAAEDEHVLFEAHLPASARAVDYVFVLEDGRCAGRDGGAGQSFRVELRALRTASPAWWEEAVLYTAPVDRFRGGVEALDGLVELGVTALLLTRVSPDPAPGGDAALARLLDEAHRRGLRLLLDVAVTWEEPLLELEHEEVAGRIAGAFERWARRGVDGFRVGAAADVPLGLLRRVADGVRGVRPEAVLLGEVVADNIHRWTGGVLDAATDFGAQDALQEWLVHRKGAARAREILERRRFFRGGPGRSTIACTATHDARRLLTKVRDPAAARLGHLLVLLRASVPAIHHGDEIGILDPEDAADWDRTTLDLFRRALRLRRGRRALRAGDEIFLDVEPAGGGAAPDQVLVFRRVAGEEIVDVLLNGGPEPSAAALPRGAPPGAELLLALGDVAFDAERGRVSLGPFAGAVLQRTVPAGVAATAGELVTQGRLRAGMAFREGRVTSPSLPVHLYVTVTELCNIRCAHCITAAPRKTRDGTARTIQPWLIEALAQAFAAAEYVAFVHGGESLAAPIFPEVLRAIQRAHAGRPYDVHLLTNGMLLDGEAARRLAGLGVTSVAFSLDGATAATNDAIRLGGRFHVILENLRGVLRARRALGVDLRVGISMVAGRSAAAELAAMGRLALELGVDWLKIEEMAPVTPLARRELLAPRDQALEDGMAALREVLRGGAVVLVDHLDPPSGCRCDAATRPALREFREADDYANRARFNPCRMAWEQACVDPDGTVHPIDYEHPPAGSLLASSFLEIWNGEPMRRLRAEWLARVPRAQRLGCPIHPLQRH